MEEIPGMHNNMGQIDFRNGWGATIVDGLSTLILAGLEEELFDALNYTVQIDFTAPDGLVDPFETIIRHYFIEYEANG